MRQITSRQSAVLDFIKTFGATNGYPPTRAEIQRHFGWHSPNAAEAHLRLLVKKKLLVIDRHTARGLRVLG